MSKFTSQVIKVVQAIPEGKVVSYGQVALYVGVPRAARQVGQILRTTNAPHHPWWRVVNNAGLLSIKGNFHHDRQEQKRLLEEEGIIVSQDFTLDIDRYRFIADEVLLRKFELPPDYIDLVLKKYLVFGKPPGHF